MNSIAKGIAATAIMATCGFYPQILSADGFTGDRFLEWSEADQRGYVSTQLVMASTIAARIKPPLSNCIAEKFFASGGMTDEGFENITERVLEFDSYHPSSVILVVIESECGAFN